MDKAVTHMKRLPARAAGSADSGVIAGCLPILIQMPVFFAFYWVLLESVEMRQAPFMGWIQDLSAKDPFYVLPLIMAVAMFVQTKLNPTPPDPTQAKVISSELSALSAMLAFLPVGLALYWVTNTVRSIAKQWNVKHRIEVEAKNARPAEESTRLNAVRF
jgi:YidC/Oxa1 family membrane protein insertase